MTAEVRQRLRDDHHAVNEVLTELLAALDRKDAQTSYARLDLLWARLAVHIRAEHLHLFPAIINRLTKSLDRADPDLSEAEALVENLRADHNFFMHELARAIGILRELPEKIVTTTDDAKFSIAGDAVREVEKRLTTHNEIEENQIYRCSSTILTEPEESELVERINAELENRPARFSDEAWANSL